jgi:hypothetical protein
VFVIGGIYFLTTEKLHKPIQSVTTSTVTITTISNKKSDVVYDLPDLTNAVGIIVGMSIIGLIFAMILVYLSAKIPKCIVYTMLILTFITLTIVGILFLFIGQIGGALGVFLIIAVLGCLLYCSRDQI